MKMTESPLNRLKKTVGKGEIVHYGEFLLFPQCFQMTCTADTYKPGLVWKTVKERVLFYYYVIFLFLRRDEYSI